MLTRFVLDVIIHQQEDISTYMGGQYEYNASASGTEVLC